MYDYYTFDLYPENYKNNDMNNNSIFISKELPIKKKIIIIWHMSNLFYRL